jgi:hypothetical protein
MNENLEPATLDDESAPASKEPWEMTEEEFNESASRGRFHTDEAEDVREVALGRKPVAIVAHPEGGDLPGQQALLDPEVSDEVDYRLFTHPKSTRTVAVVVRKGANPDDFVEWYKNFLYEQDENDELKLKDVREKTLREIEFGKFLGYSIDDINFYLKQNYGYGSVIKDAKESGLLPE